MSDDQNPLERLASRQQPRGAQQVLHAAQEAADRQRRRRRLTAAAAAVVVVVGGIAGAWLLVDVDGSSVRTTDPPSESTTTTAETTTTIDTTTSTTPTTATTLPTDDDLPGEPTASWPGEGVEASVVGVASDDTLNVRDIPGTEGDIIAQLDPLASGVVPTGRNRRLSDDEVWSEVSVNGTTGWVHNAYIGVLGRSGDATDRLYPAGTPRPSAATVRELASSIADSMASEGANHLDVTIVDGPTENPPQFTIDITGLRDDSSLGSRYQFVAEPAGGQFTVSTVEETVLCRRGGSAEPGVCL